MKVDKELFISSFEAGLYTWTEMKNKFFERTKKEFY